MARFASHEIIRSYLQDAIAAEEHQENHLRDFAADARQEPAVQELLVRHAGETRRQAAWLKMRLETLHGSPSGVKSLRAQLTWLGPKLGLLGHDPVERVAQNLMAAYTVECGEVVMYEALAVAAATAGDTETERLARGIQEEERRMAERLWSLIQPGVREAFVRLTGADAREHPEAIAPAPSSAFPGTREMPDYPGATERVTGPADEDLAARERIAALAQDPAAQAPRESGAQIWMPSAASQGAAPAREGGVAVLDPAGPDV